MKRGNKSRAKGKTLSTRNLTESRVSAINQRYAPINDKAKVEQLIQRLKKDLNGPMGMKFIKTVFYPELYKARIPYSLNNSSTAVVTHMEEVDVSTGADGSGMLFFFPKVTTGPCIYQYLPDTTGGIGSIYIYQWNLAAATGAAGNGTYTKGGTAIGIAQNTYLVTSRPVLSTQDYSAALLASCGDPTVTAVNAIAPQLFSRVLFSHPIDNISTHPMILDFINGSPITPGTVQKDSLIVPYDLVSLNNLNTLLNAAPLSNQTSLNHNFDQILPDLTTIFAQVGSYKGVTGNNANFATTLFVSPTAPWALNGAIPYATGAFKFTDTGLLGSQLLTSSNSSAAGTTVSGWTGLGYQNYSTNYDKAALVGASISLEYVGRFDFESGYIAASHVEDMPIDEITTSDIDMGQFSVKSKPNEGLRMVWQPTVQSDFELFFTSPSDSATLGARVPSQSMYGFEKIFQKPATDTTEPRFLKVQTAAPCIAIYWKGMTKSQNGFRLTITRRFNMIPNKAAKPIADLNRPDINIDPLLTMQKVFQLTRLAPFGGSTLTDAALYSGVRQNFINTIEFNPNLKFGSLRDLNTALTGELQGDPASNDQG